MKVKHKPDYRKRRREEYPLLSEQLDAIWKGGDAESQMRQRIMEIKRQFPKWGQTVSRWSCGV